MTIRILVIDDHPMVRAGVRAELENSGADLEVVGDASDVEGAIAACRALTPDVLMRIAEIVHHMQRRQYRMANDSYLQLSIGNAPWPIGVTMVGIHERSGREKIFSSNVAHVLNDEVSRKYIQSLKRLMTFAQTRYPPGDISMMMG